MGGGVRPIVYLDIDDVLIRCPDNESSAWWKANPRGGPAYDVKRVLTEMRAMCDVRWLTCWAISGGLAPEGEQRLAGILDVPLALVSSIRNPQRFQCTRKTDGIDFAATVPWVWFDDSCFDEERAVLRGHHAEDRYVCVNTSKDHRALAVAWDAFALANGLRGHA